MYSTGSKLVTNRRCTYRLAKRVLHKNLYKHWKRSRADLEKHIRAFLRKKDRTYLLRLVRKQAFALTVATTLLISTQSNAEVPVEIYHVTGGSGGFAINGLSPGDKSGFSVSGGGDVNGDLIPDIVVGAYFADPGDPERREAGESYVVFGKEDGTAVNASSIAAGTGGFIINGDTTKDYSGRSVSIVGDMNGDGFDEIIIGAHLADPGGNGGAGEVYVIFGKNSTLAVELSSIAAGNGGFVINGINYWDYSGKSVSSAGDVNGDGKGDLIIGAPGVDQGTENSVGESYVIFGKSTTTPVNLSDIVAGTGDGFVILGIDEFDNSGRAWIQK